MIFKSSTVGPAATIGVSGALFRVIRIVVRDNLLSVVPCSVPMGDDTKTLSDGLRGLTNTVNNLVTKFENLSVTVHNIGGKVDRLAPLAPVASKLAALPEKVVNLQASAFENADQVCALNLALIRIESTQRDGKAPVAEDGDVLSSNTPNDKPKPPPT